MARLSSPGERLDVDGGDGVALVVEDGDGPDLLRPEPGEGDLAELDPARERGVGLGLDDARGDGGGDGGEEEDPHDEQEEDDGEKLEPEASFAAGARALDRLPWKTPPR